MSPKASTDTGTWDTAVELSHVSKQFKQTRRGKTGPLKGLFHPEQVIVNALDDVSFRIGPGEFVAYAGPNGAGKSTTFKLLCGILAPTQGTVRVMGKDPMTSRIPLMKETGVLFGNRTELWWDHPVMASYRWKKEVWQIEDRVFSEQLAQAVELLGLEDILETFARELSLGQRMRADLGMMLLHKPKLILLDEPTLGLDVLAKRKMIAYLKYLNAQEKVTILVTSHDMDDLTEMARRLVLISAGRIAFDGNTQELMAAAGQNRRIILRSPVAPALSCAKYISSEDHNHTYSFDASKVPVSALLSEIGTLSSIEDIRMSDAPVEETIAGLYEKWNAKEPE